MAKSFWYEKDNFNGHLTASTEKHTLATVVKMLRSAPQPKCDLIGAFDTAENAKSQQLHIF